MLSLCLALALLTTAPTTTPTSAADPADAAPDAPATTPATQPAGLVSLRQQARTAIEQRLGDLPALGEKSLDQIVQVKLQEGRLVVSTDLPDTNGPARVQIPGLGGINVISVRRGALAAGAPPDHALRAIQLQHYSLDHPTAYVVEASLAALPGMVSIAASWQSMTSSRTVQIIEQVPLFMEPDNPQVPQISVFVQQFSGIDQDHETARLRLSAPDLPTLLREHPREVREYVQPALAELGLESLVSVDPHVAWQVFTDAYTSDPKISAQVRQILPQLDAPDFPTRAAATDALRDLGAPGALELLTLDRSTLSAEQRSSIDQVIAAYRTLTPDRVRELRQDKEFLIDCLLLDDVRLRQAALHQLRQRTEQSIAFDVNAPAPTRVQEVNALRQSLLPPPATRNVPAS